MKRDRLSIVVLCVMFGIWQSASGAMVNPSIAKAKTEAEARGYIFLTGHDEIISAAKKEGKLRVVSGLSPESLKTMVSAFRKKYPFIDISAHETTGSDEHQRILLELKAGMNKEWDAISMANDFYNEYGPYQKKFDILGMSQNGVVQIHRNMIDPRSRLRPCTWLNSRPGNKGEEVVAGGLGPLHQVTRLSGQNSCGLRFSQC